MNNNEFKLREITLSLAVLNQKEKLNAAEQELYNTLTKRREKLLKETDSR